MATYDLTTTTPSKIKTGDIINIPYSGSEKSITLPEGTYKLEVWGAQGGYLSSTAYGGKGGYSYGTLNLTQETTIYAFAGGAGNSGNTIPTNTSYYESFNGGGWRYWYKGGGGASDFRIGSNSLYARVIVAGGGGSDGGASYPGGAGGGTNGILGSGGYGTTYGYGTQTGSSDSIVTEQNINYESGGFGFGGTGTYRKSGYGGAGGSGWYGGGGVYPDASGDDEYGGGGGSGYVYTSSTASNYPSGCLLNSSYYLTDAATVAGDTSFIGTSGTAETGHSGDGYCRITVIDVKTSLNGYVKAYEFPNEYTFWESVAPSTTAQYLLKTSTVPSGKTKLRFKFKVTATTKDSCLFCSRKEASGTDSTSNTLFLLQNGNFRRDYYGSSLESGINYVKAGDTVTVEIEGGKTWINGKLFTNFTDVYTQSPAALIFGGSYTYSNYTATYNTTHIASNCNFNFIKLYNSDGSERRYYRPCKDNSDNLYLYSLTNNVATALSASAVTFLGEAIDDWREVKGVYVKTNDSYKLVTDWGPYTSSTWNLRGGNS